MMPQMKTYPFLIFLLLVACAPVGTEQSTLPIDTSIATETRAPFVTVAATNPDGFSDCPLPAHEGEVGKFRLVYIIQGNLWLLDQSREPVQMSASGDVEQVMLSPDGSQIVLSRRRNADTVELWVVDSLGWHNLSGEQGIPENIEFISFSDDGQVVAFYRLVNPGRELWVADIKSASVRRLVGLEDLRPQEGSASTLSAGFDQVTWIHGTHLLTAVPYIFTIPGGGDSGPPPEPVLWVDADTGEQKASFPIDPGSQITYSPNGRMLVIADPERVRLIQADNPGASQTIFSYPPMCILDCYTPQPVWRADSSSFLLEIPSEGMNPDDFLDGLEEPFTIWEVSADGNMMTRLSEIFRIPGTFFFSPDLERVAYYRRENTLDLHIANVDGSEDILYDSNQGGEFYGWAPDSRHFVYQDTQLMMGDICGMTHLLTDVADAEFLGWLDATRFLMHVSTSGGWDLYLGTAAGESTRLLGFGASVIYDYVVIPE